MSSDDTVEIPLFALRASFCNSIACKCVQRAHKNLRRLHALFQNTMFSKKLCSTKALVIIGIVTVLIAAIITTGVLLGIFLQTEAQLKIIKVSVVYYSKTYM